MRFKMKTPIILSLIIVLSACSFDNDYDTVYEYTPLDECILRSAIQEGYTDVTLQNINNLTDTEYYEIAYYYRDSCSSELNASDTGIDSAARITAKMIQDSSTGTGTSLNSISGEYGLSQGATNTYKPVEMEYNDYTGIDEAIEESYRTGKPLDEIMNNE